MEFRLLTFGEPRLLDQDGQALFLPEKALFVMALLKSGGPALRSREELTRLLWDSDERSIDPKAPLRKLLSRVKQKQDEIGAGILHIDTRAVGLGDARVAADFLSLGPAAAGDPFERLEAILAHYNGIFFARMDDLGTAGRSWRDHQRAEVEASVLAALDAGMDAAADPADYRLVKEAAFRILDVNPNEEAAYRVLMRVYAADGQRRQIHEIFERCQRQLWADLKARPDEKTLELVRALGQASGAIAACPPVPCQATAHHEAGATIQPAYMPRLALLPPRFQGAAGESGWVAATLLEDITIGLSSLKTVKLVGSHTAQRITQSENPAGRLSDLGIDYTLETSWSLQPGRLQLFVRLHHEPDDAVIVADRYPMEPEQLGTTYGAIARRIVASICGQIELRELSREQFERHPAAYHHFLIGKRHLQRLGLPDIRRARKAFRAALGEYPFFSPALSGLARTAHMEWLVTARGDRALLDAATEHAGRAIELGKDLASGYRELGVAKLFLGDFDESMEAFELAEIAGPHYADVKADHADTLIHASQPEHGLAKVLEAIDLNPVSPDVYLWTAAGAAYHLGRYKEAIDYLSQMVDREPANRLAAASWAMLGEHERARALARRARDTHPDFDIETWLTIVPIREEWQKDHYREGLRKAGF